MIKNLPNIHENSQFDFKWKVLCVVILYLAFCHSYIFNQSATQAILLYVSCASSLCDRLDVHCSATVLSSILFLIFFILFPDLTFTSKYNTSPKFNFVPTTALDIAFWWLREAGMMLKMQRYLMLEPNNDIKYASFWYHLSYILYKWTYCVTSEQHVYFVTSAMLKTSYGWTDGMAWEQNLCLQHKSTGYTI